ncbi:MAG: hypothetical protein H6566_10165 [Lewinellaceae bacterium]|nr:hypothetical protein [Lewinellaceae bacterium]
MKFLLSVLLILTQGLLFSQETINVLCLDFKKNNENFSRGREFRLSFESVLSNLDNAPILVEREKLGELLAQIQNERNLQRDVNNHQIIALKAAKVDYVIYGEFFASSLRETVEFRSECVNISNENATTKIVFPTISFEEKELSNFSLFEERIRKMLNNYSFVEGLGVVESKQLDEINRRLKEKDQQIRNLESKVDMLKSGNMYKILFNGSYFVRKGASTSVTGGTKESILFDKIAELEKQKNPVEIIKICDDYISGNPDSGWWTPYLAKGIALLNLRRFDEGFEILDKIVDEVPGEEDYMIRIANVYKQIPNQEKYNDLLEKVPLEIKRLIEKK